MMLANSEMVVQVTGTPAARRLSIWDATAKWEAELPRDVGAQIVKPLPYGK